MENPETVYIVEPGLQGNEDCATLAVYQNLAPAFQHLWYIDQFRVLWIYSICINQEDIPERNKQIKRMANIYKLAYRVLAWLGTEEYDSKHALTTLQYIGNQLEATNAGRLIRTPGAEQPDLWMNAHCFAYDDQTLAALLKVLERSWFYRF
jgi:hypothetical protein